jgi:serine phosphatase RsbU (regulator of sigma subunit)/catechol 2,3-dioxygenase-like lactoylglutathione lyase family enzyme
MASSFLRLQTVTVYVRDQDQSLQFYLDKLHFKLITDILLPDGTRWIAIAPRDGIAMLALIAPPPDSAKFHLIGRDTEVIFLAEDMRATLDEWRQHGIRFREVPLDPSWSGTFATFDDLDGNSFALVGYDEATQRIEAERQAEAARVEAERSAAQEFQIAKQVQARLFPQSKPQGGTLDYTGTCVQARQVGGDYYDFFPLGPDRIGLVVGDIAGKGIAGALLMANLQANLRSQCVNALDDPIARLPLVNQIFYENTADTSYATLFFAEYDARNQWLRYANCGHLPGLLLRTDGLLLRLNSTCTVLGLFENWNCVMEEVAFLPGDWLLLFTDGLSEAANPAGEDFGEERIIECLKRFKQSSPEALIAEMIQEVRRFSPLEQQDDITVIAARVLDGGKL